MSVIQSAALMKVRSEYVVMAAMADAMNVLVEDLKSALTS